MKGMGNDHILSNATYISDSVVEGELYAVSIFPGYVPGNGTVKGELYKVDDDILKVMDALEGYYSDNLPYSMYRREKIESISAFIYVWNSPIDGIDRIEDGDYRQWINSKYSSQ